MRERDRETEREDRLPDTWSFLGQNLLNVLCNVSVDFCKQSKQHLAGILKIQTEMFLFDLPFTFWNSGAC